MSFRLPHRHTHLRQKGFTLIELLVVTGITAMIMLTATSMFATFLLSSARSNARRQLQAEGNEVIRKMEFVIRNARDVPTCTGGVSTITLSTVTNSSTTLGLNVTALEQDGVDITSANVRAVTTGSTPVFTCTTLGSGSTKYVDVVFTLQPLAASDYSTISQDFKTTIQIRNTSF